MVEGRRHKYKAWQKNASKNGTCQQKFLVFFLRHSHTTTTRTHQHYSIKLYLSQNKKQKNKEKKPHKLTGLESNGQIDPHPICEIKNEAAAPDVTSRLVDTRSKIRCDRSIDSIRLRCI
jgi:hypothetical protein